MAPSVEISEAESPQQIAIARDLFLEYAKSLNFDLCFQSFDQELAGLPGRYSPPAGRLLLGMVDGKIGGCVAMRGLGDRVCEMKRLYVKTEFRGTGLGSALTKAVIQVAREAGFQKMRLDTVLPLMEKAVSMYRKLGF